MMSQWRINSIKRNYPQCIADLIYIIAVRYNKSTIYLIQSYMDMV